MTKHPHQTVVIQYGIAAGQRQGVRLRKCLRQAGYEVIRDPAKADIILAHSAGCFELPLAPTTQKLLLINPSYWPGRTPWQRGRKRIRSNLRYRKYNYPLAYWLQRNAWGWFYLLRDLKRSRWIFKHVYEYDLEQAIRNHRAILVRNDDDDWLTDDLDYLDEANPGLTIVRIPGDHDDLLFNPAPYVALLRRFD